MNLELTPTLEQFVRTRLESGEYHSQNEVVCEALRLLMRREEYRDIQLQQLRVAIQQGDEAIARGDYIDVNGTKELEALFATF